ncbi:MAG: hypothetical protein JWO76_1713 [Nocardioides sp.]|nr:hypothetical protein [Nocardioides sp.]
MTTTAELPTGLVHAAVWPVAEHPDVELLQGMLESLATLAGDPGREWPGADAHRVDQLGLLERLKGAAAAAQARVTTAFGASQLTAQDRYEVGRARRGRGIADQVALARGCPSSQGLRHVGFAQAMTEMPHTLGLLTRGEIGEWPATLLVQETAILSLEDRKTVDERLCAMSVDTTTGEVCPPLVLDWTPRRVRNAARALASELDPEAAVKRAGKATRDRRVTIRPAPDTMTYVTGLLPVAQGVAAFANLRASAKAVKASGDARTESQIMADLFVERLTGQATASAVPVEIGLVMTPDTLLGTSDRPARTPDGTVVPAGCARDLARHPDAPRWLRRIFTDKLTGVVTQVDPRRRRLTRHDGLVVDLRDQTCRHPGCESPIADHDHVLRHADDGPSTLANAQGLCEGHNLVKEMPGWHARVTDPRPGHHTVVTTTPTGHTYRSQAPPGLPPPV